MRWVPLFLVLAVGALYLRARAADDASGALAGAQAVRVGELPPALQGVYAALPDPGTLLRSAGALPGLGAIAGHGTAADAPEAIPFADIGTRRRVRSVRRDIRRDLAALNALSDTGGASPAEAAQTLAEVYSAPVLAALGADGRRAFAAGVAGRIDRHVRVLGYDGIFVSGRRALAQVVYRVSVRVPSGRFLAGRPHTWTVTLAREHGRWRFVRGFE